MGNRRIILELDREPQDLQAVWRLDSIARLIQQALITPTIDVNLGLNIGLLTYTIGMSRKCLDLAIQL